MRSMHRGMMAAALLGSMTLSLPTDVRRGSKVDPFENNNEPIDTGRRAEKDARAIAKAEAKRKRKAEKRMKESANG